MNRFKLGIVTVLMVFVLNAVPLSAEELTVDEKAEVLYELGLFSGTSAEAFVPNLEGGANREQAAKMVAVALGWTVVSDARSEFADVSEWAQPYVALVVGKEVTRGIGLSRETGYPLFGGSNAITERQLATWFDRVITGSETAWEDNADLDDTVGITRGQLVDATYNALRQVPTGQEERLIEKVLAGDGDRLRRASEGGLLEDAPPKADGVRPDIEDIAVNDDDKLILTFTEAVEAASAADISHYTVYDNTYNEIEGIVEESVVLDATRVMLKFTKKFTGPHRIAVMDVLDVTGEAALTQTAFEMSVNGGDKSISSIDETDDKTIKLTFSSKLNTSAAVNESYYTVYDEQGQDVSDQIKKIECPYSKNVEITFDSYLAGRYILRVNGLPDRYGKVIKDQLTFNMDFSEGPPRIVAVVIRDEDKIKVTFSEAIDETSAENPDSYKLYDEQGYRVEESVERADIDGDKEVRIRFDDRLGGTYTLKAFGVKDLDGETSENEFKFYIDKDGSTPVIDWIEAEDGNRIAVTFSKAMNASDIDDKEFYSLFMDGTDVTSYIKSISRRSEDEVLVYFDRRLDGTFILGVEGAEDLNGNNMDDEEDFEIMPDYANPSLNSVELIDDDEVLLTFSESIEPGSAEDPDNYRLLDEEGNVLKDVIASVHQHEDDGKKVTVMFEEDMEGTFTIEVEDIEDFYENTGEGSKSFTNTGDWYPPSIEDVYARDMITIVVTFTEPVNSYTATRRGNYSLHDNEGNNISGTIESISMADEDRVVITLDEGLYKSYNIRVVNVKDLTGNAMDDNWNFELDFD